MTEKDITQQQKEKEQQEQMNHAHEHHDHHAHHDHHQKDAEPQAQAEVANDPRIEKAKFVAILAVVAALAIIYLAFNLDFSTSETENKEKEQHTEKEKLLKSAITPQTDPEEDGEDTVQFLDNDWLQDDFSLDDDDNNEPPIIPLNHNQVKRDEKEDTTDQVVSGSVQGTTTSGGLTGNATGANASTKPPAVTVNFDDVDDAFGDLPDKNDNHLSRKEELEKRSSNIVFRSGQGGNDDFFSYGNPDNSKSARGLSKTSSSQVQATRIGDMSKIIVQGKRIEVILESAINTNAPGPVTAIVARDVYSESGKNILIKKGAKVIGSYSSSGLVDGYAVVQIVWDRLIMSNGVDVNISSSTVDELGRAGTTGEYHGKWFSKMVQATLTSAIPIIVSGFLPHLSTSNNNNNSNNGNNDGGNTNDNSAVAAAISANQNNEANARTAQVILDSGTRAATLLSDAVRTGIGDQPYITLKNGTHIFISVNKDLIFPEEAIDGKRIVML